MRKRIWLILGMFLVLAVSALAQTETRFTVEYRGQAYVNGSLVLDGTLVSIWANNGTTLMDTAVAGYGQGYFNHLEIIWDDPATLEDEGISYDDFTQEKIIFKINRGQVQNPAFLTVTTLDRGKTISVDLDKPLVISTGESLVDISWLWIALVVVMILSWYSIKKKSLDRKGGKARKK